MTQTKDNDEIDETLGDVMACAVVMSTPLCAFIVDRFFSAAQRDSVNKCFMDIYHDYSSGNPIYLGESIESEFHLKHEERVWRHAKLWETKRTLHEIVHCELYRVASGRDFQGMVTPRYLRSLVGMAYHVGFIGSEGEEAAVGYYQNILTLHTLNVRSPRRLDPFIPSGLVKLAGRLIAEQKALGLFKNEATTDELMVMAKAIN